MQHLAEHPPTGPRWTSPQRWLHWLTLGLLMLGAAALLLREGLDERAARATLLTLHRAAGLIVFLLVCARLGLRWQRRQASAGTAGPSAAGLASAAVHAGLYGLLLALPLLGWALGSARGLHDLPLPPIVPADTDLADTLEGWHAAAGWALLALTALHALAAAWHHLVRRDGVLDAMLGRDLPSPTPESHHDHP